MFKRVILDEWTTIVPIFSFCTFFIVFLVVTLRALRLGKEERERLSSLPLESNAETPNSDIP
jgi:hypothetical protein